MLPGFAPAYQFLYLHFQVCSCYGIHAHLMQSSSSCQQFPYHGMWTDCCRHYSLSTHHTCYAQGRHFEALHTSITQCLLPAKLFKNGIATQAPSIVSMHRCQGLPKMGVIYLYLQEGVGQQLAGVQRSAEQVPNELPPGAVKLVQQRCCSGPVRLVGAVPPAASTQTRGLGHGGMSVTPGTATRPHVMFITNMMHTRGPGF